MPLVRGLVAAGTADTLSSPACVCLPATSPLIGPTPD